MRFWDASSRKSCAATVRQAAYSFSISASCIDPVGHLQGLGVPYPCMLSRDQKAGGWGHILDSQSVLGAWCRLKDPSFCKASPILARRGSGISQSGMRLGFLMHVARGVGGVLLETLHIEATFQNRIKGFMPRVSRACKHVELAHLSMHFQV